MKIERVDDKTIKCYLSMDELEKYQVDYHDFISRTDKAQRLMREIIAKATEEVGYHPPQMAFEMQIMMVPEQGMVLTFSEKEPFDGMDDEKVQHFLQGIKNLLEHVKKERGGVDLPPGDLPELPAGEQPVEHSKTGPEMDEAVFCFGDLRSVMDYAAVLPRNHRYASALYKMGDGYYLYLGRGSAAYTKYSRACVNALEYAELYSAGPDCVQVLKEHGEVLIPEKALRKLAGPKKG